MCILLYCIRGLTIVTKLCYYYSKIINKHSYISLREELQSYVTWELRCSKLFVIVQRIVQASNKIDDKYQHYRHFVGISMSCNDFERILHILVNKPPWSWHKDSLALGASSIDTVLRIYFCTQFKMEKSEVTLCSVRATFYIWHNCLPRNSFSHVYDMWEVTYFHGIFVCETVATQFINQVNYMGLWVLLAIHSGYSTLIPGYTLQKCLLENPCPQHRIFIVC